MTLDVVRQDAATPGGAAIPAELLTAPDTGIWRRLLFRLGIIDTIRVWGQELRVPAHRMTGPWLWRVRMQRYERDEAAALSACLRRDLPLIECGGGFGAVACFANGLLDAPDEHIVVEMDPELCQYLESNATRNGAQYRIINAAVATRPVRLEARPDFIGQQATPNGSVHIPVRSLRNLIADVDSPVNLFLDVEGMEVELIHHDPALLQARVAVLVLELHGHKAPRAEAAWLPIDLHELGFDPIWTRGTVWAFRNRRLGGLL